MTTMTASSTTLDEIPSDVFEIVDLDILESLYRIRRARQRDDAGMLRFWTARMDELLDWRAAHAELAPAA